MKQIKITINSKEILAEQGKTILEIAKENKIKIPTLCFHPDLKPGASCRICLVQIKGEKNFCTACSTEAREGMEIFTNTFEIEKARKINLELLFAQHKEECKDCVFEYNCKFLKLADKYDVKISRFADRKTKFPVYQFGPAIVFDSAKCIDCRNCVEICKQKESGFLDIEEKNGFFEVIPTKNKKIDCIYCGQCIIHCPVGAFEAVGEFEDIEKPLKAQNKFVVFQFAPAIRSSIGEEFGLEPGLVVTGKIVAAIRKLGANMVFDTSVGADFTTFEEAKEMIERHKTKKGLPIFSSCCPSWVKFIEFFHPEYIANLATTRSPQVILGGMIKTYLLKSKNINPKNIVVVSVMPCTSKKYEIQRSELKINGVKPVDYVLTTRELAYLLIKNKIDLKNIEPEQADNPFGEPSGAGVIYGASGGVAESVLRTVYEKITGQKLQDIEFREIRGEKGIKTASFKIKGEEIRIAVVDGIDNAKKVLNQIKENPNIYHCVEVMACPGGCIGGGGQPLPSDKKIRESRAKALYEIDKQKQIRAAHENPAVKEMYKKYLTDEKTIRKICHTRYYKKKREN